MSEDFWKRSAGGIDGYNNLLPFGEQMPSSSPQMKLASSAGGRFKLRHQQAHIDVAEIRLARDGFTSKELDAETGLYYFGARYYDSWSGRWMSVDPLAKKYPGWSPYNHVQPFASCAILNGARSTI